MCGAFRSIGAQPNQKASLVSIRKILWFYVSKETFLVGGLGGHIVFDQQSCQLKIANLQSKHGEVITVQYGLASRLTRCHSWPPFPTVSHHRRDCCRSTLRTDRHIWLCVGDCCWKTRWSSAPPNAKIMDAENVWWHSSLKCCNMVQSKSYQKLDRWQPSDVGICIQVYPQQSCVARIWFFDPWSSLFFFEFVCNTFGKLPSDRSKTTYCKSAMPRTFSLQYGKCAGNGRIGWTEVLTISRFRYLWTPPSAFLLWLVKINFSGNAQIAPTNRSRYRTMYYHTLGKLLFMDIRDNKEVGLWAHVGAKFDADPTRNFGDLCLFICMSLSLWYSMAQVHVYAKAIINFWYPKHHASRIEAFEKFMEPQGRSRPKGQRWIQNSIVYEITKAIHTSRNIGCTYDNKHL